MGYIEFILCMRRLKSVSRETKNRLEANEFASNLFLTKRLFIIRAGFWLLPMPG
jgi:hypothetical protein